MHGRDSVATQVALGGLSGQEGLRLSHAVYRDRFPTFTCCVPSVKNCVYFLNLFGCGRGVETPGCGASREFCFAVSRI